MRIGLGHLGYPPQVFWAVSLNEFFAAVDGYLERKGVKRAAGRAGAAMTRAELMDLIRRDAEGTLHGRSGE